MTEQFTTAANPQTYYNPKLEKLTVGKVYRVKFAGEMVRARFLGTEVEFYLSRGLRHAGAFRKWERV